MKICLISPQYPGFGGYGVYLSYLTKGLRARGHNVHTLTGPPPATHAYTPEASFHILPTGSYEGFRFVNFELTVNQRLSKLHQQETFDLIQYNLPTYFGLPIFRPPSLPLIITAHGCVGQMVRDFLRFRPRGLDLADLVYMGAGPLIPQIERWAYSKANRVVTVCDWVRRTLNRLYHLPPERLVTIHNGVDTNHFKPIKDPHEQIKRVLGAENLGRPIILYVGRIMGAKDPATLAQAIPLVLRFHKDALFLFRGEGVTLQTFLRSLLSALIPRNSYRFIDFVGSGDLPALYSSASVYVLPSIHEPFAYTLLEALSCAAPTVASDVGGIPEVVKHERTGLLVKPRNPVALADALTRMLDDEKLARRLGAAARETMEAGFSLKTFVDGFEREVERFAN